ncbi:MAG: hypothetical protein ACK47B_17240 [Armatimonadota bacterium]
MPELDIQHRPNPGMSWLPWVIGAVLLALIAWGVYEVVTPERATGPATTTDQVAGQREETPPAGTQPGEGTGTMAGAALPLAAITQAPNTYFGQPVEGTATVAEVVSDRGYWVEEGGSRMFVVQSEQLPEAALDVNAGQRVRIRGTVMDTQQMGQTPDVANMDQQARQILQDQPAFIHATDVTILDRTTSPGTMTTPGTNGAETTMPGTTNEPGTTTMPGTTNEPGTSTMPGTR